VLRFNSTCMACCVRRGPGKGLQICNNCKQASLVQLMDAKQKLRAGLATSKCIAIARMAGKSPQLDAGDSTYSAHSHRGTAHCQMP